MGWHKAVMPHSVRLSWRHGLGWHTPLYSQTGSAAHWVRSRVPHWTPASTGATAQREATIVAATTDRVTERMTGDTSSSAVDVTFSWFVWLLEKEGAESFEG